MVKDNNKVRIFACKYRQKWSGRLDWGSLTSAQTLGGSDMTQTYPRVYRFKGWALLLWASLELAIIALGAATVLFAGMMFKNAAVVGWGVGGFLIALGLVALLSSSRGKLVLFADRCEYTGILGTRVLRTSEVKETRNVKRQYGHLVATVVLKNGRKVTISDFGHLDDPLTEWLDGFPNAEAKAQDARAEALLANPAFGSNPTEREHHINADVGLINFIGWPCYGLVLWAMIWPHPYQICLPILLTLPVLGLLATFASRGRWTMLESETNGRLSIGIRLFIGPALIVALRAFLDDQVVDWVLPAVCGVAAGVCLAALNSLIERRLSWASAAGFVILWSAFAWGGLLYVDTTLDPSPGRAFPVRVLDKSEGEHVDTLTVTAWGSRASGTDVDVAGALSRKVHKGDTVCIHVYRGRLNWPWYAVDLCAQGK